MLRVFQTKLRVIQQGHGLEPSYPSASLTLVPCKVPRLHAASATRQYSFLVFAPYRQKAQSAFHGEPTVSLAIISLPSSVAFLVWLSREENVILAGNRPLTLLFLPSVTRVAEIFSSEVKNLFFLLSYEINGCLQTYTCHQVFQWYWNKNLMCNRLIHVFEK